MRVEIIGAAPSLIGFTGYAGAGKNTIAEAVQSLGYQEYTIGSIIKNSLRPGETCIGIDRLVYSVEQKYTKYYDMLPEIAKAYLECKLGRIDPFTDDPDIKSSIRPLLEVIGLADYKTYFDKFFANMPKNCVNTRVSALDEANEWKRRGGIIIEVIRQGVGPASKTEESWLWDLKVAGSIDFTFANWGDPKESKKRFLDSLAKFVAAQRHAADPFS